MNDVMAAKLLDFRAVMVRDPRCVKYESGGGELRVDRARAEAEAEAEKLADALIESVATLPAVLHALLLARTTTE